jgi:Peptidase family M28
LPKAVRLYFPLFAIALAVSLNAARFGAVNAAVQAAIDLISADSMRADLSFLASDALAGRDTPSPGLDVAAEFIASRFRRAGLEPVGPGGSYFQDASFAVATPNLSRLSVTLEQDGEELDLDREDVRLEALDALEVKGAPVVKLPANGALPDVAGKIVAGEARRWGDEALLARLQAKKPAMILLMSRRVRPKDPDQFLQPLDLYSAPVLRIYNADAAASLARRADIAVSVHAAAPARRNVVLRNVAGILRGSDPQLAAQAVVVSAHYDHLGEEPPGPGDRIFNGANDNGSGVVSVTEIAGALATLHPRPRRTIVFVTFFGEEEGLLGAYYYVRHPLVPLKDTVANINLEQMGRTDDEDGKQVGSFAFTGPSYSDLPQLVSGAAREEGVRTWSRNSADDFFDRSDNYAFALRGVIAHTIVVAFEYPDYHAVRDEWRKIDYQNMAKVDRGVAAGILAVADAPDRPKWSDAGDAAQYRDVAGQQ